MKIIKMILERLRRINWGLQDALPPVPKPFSWNDLGVKDPE